LKASFGLHSKSISEKKGDGQGERERERESFKASLRSNEFLVVGERYVSRIATCRKHCREDLIHNVARLTE
jgi:hypothetical protein